MAVGLLVPMDDGERRLVAGRQKETAGSIRPSQVSPSRVHRDSMRAYPGGRAESTWSGSMPRSASPCPDCPSGRSGRTRDGELESEARPREPRRRWSPDRHPSWRSRVARTDGPRLRRPPTSFRTLALANLVSKTAPLRATALRGSVTANTRRGTRPASLRLSPQLPATLTSASEESCSRNRAKCPSVMTSNSAQRDTASPGAL